MDTPEPFSQAWEKQGQRHYPPGLHRENNTPYPSNTVLPPQMAQGQGYSPLQSTIPGIDDSPQQPSPWNMSSRATGSFPPPSTPLPASGASTPSWNRSGMPNTGNLDTPQIGRLNSSYLQPANSPVSSPNANNSWANGSNTTGSFNGSNNFASPNTPVPPNNTSSLNAKRSSSNNKRIGKILLLLGLALLVVTVGTAGAYMLKGPISPLLSITKDKPTVQPTPTPTVHMQHQLLAQHYTAQMSLDDEIAQLLMVEDYSADYTALATMMSQQHVGSVILYKTAIVSSSQVQNNISMVQQQSKIPIFVSIDEEGWNVGRLGDLYPNYSTYRMDARAMGLSGDPNVAAQQGEQTAKDLLSLGINMNLAPDVDVSTDDDYIGYDRRSFGATPDAVIKYAGPYVKALQSAGVVGTLKHFPGLGSIPKGFDPHAVLPVYTGTKDQLYQTDLVPFKHFIQDTDPNEQAHVIMSTDMLVKAIDPTYPAELSHTFITDILRNQLGFQGVILSDSLHMGGVLVNGEALSLADACVLAMEAGNDILEGASTPTEVQDIIDAIKVAVQSGKVTKAQIDASVTRVLTLKMDFNVMPATAS